MVQEGQQFRKDLQTEDTELELDLVELMYRLLEKIRYIAAASVACALLAGLFTAFCITPVYKATSKLYVLNSDDSALNLSDLQIGTYLAADYQEVFSNWHVHEMVIERLGLSYTYNQLGDMVSVANPSGTRILYITVTSPDPNEAKQIADAYANVAQEFIALKMETREPNVFEEALLPSSPSSPSMTKIVVLAFLAGMLVSCAVISVQFIVDDRIRTAEDIEKHFDMPTLGTMPLLKHTSGKKVQGEGQKGGSRA